jgi:RNA helicase./Plasmid replication protein.
MAVRVIRAKNMMYAQQLDHLSVADVNALETRVKSLGAEKWALIVHDKDVDKDGKLVAPHVQVMLHFKNAHSLNAIAKALGDKPQYLEKWNENANNGFSYLIHATQKARQENKYHYDKKKVIANFDYVALMNEVPKKVKKSDDTDDAIIINDTLDALDQGIITPDEAADKLTGSQYAKAKTRIKFVVQKRMERLARKWRKEMKEQKKSINVIWIYGNAGTGKTRAAKRFAERQGRDWYLSGSSRDPFQGYAGQPIVILDELRPTTFAYEDLLKMLDPFGTTAMAASRYYDKPLTADTIIVTTPYSPLDFYSETKRYIFSFNDKVDSYYQLARRISLVQWMTDDFIEAGFLDATTKSFKIDASTKQANPSSSKGIGSLVLAKKSPRDIYAELNNSAFTVERDNKMLPPTPAKATDDNTHSKAD